MSELDKRATAPTENRKPWQPLGYDKIAAAEAELGVGGPTFDGTSYS